MSSRASRRGTIARAESSTALASARPRTVSALARTMSDSRWSSDARTLLLAAPAFDESAGCRGPDGGEPAGELALGRDVPPAPESVEIATCGRAGAVSTRTVESGRDRADERVVVSDGVVPTPDRLRHASSPTLISTA